MPDESNEERFIEEELNEFDDEDFEEDEQEFDCGMMFDQNGKMQGCQLAGSEDCDWECPYRAEFEEEAEEEDG